ncbi:MAG: Clp1/GlmU family protein [Pseudomonadota bacterium]
MTEGDLDIPGPWKRSAEQILGSGWHRILVVGASDRGKSSYCNVLVNALLREGRRVSFVDADIGQKDVGPPATVSLANLHAPTPLNQADCDALYFVGHISPVAHLLPLVLGTRRMVEAAAGEFVVVDTTGLVQGKGRILKGFLIESLRPDVLVCLERGEELAPIRHAARQMNILRLRPSTQAVAKSPQARRRSREAAFERHFRDAQAMELGLGEVIVQRTALFNGRPIHDPRYHYAEQLPDGFIAVGDGVAAQDLKRTELLPPHFADHLLCGVADGHGDCLGLGIIRGIDFARRRLSLWTPVPKHRIRILQFGDMYLEPGGRELHLGRLGRF